MNEESPGISVEREESETLIEVKDAISRDRKPKSIGSRRVVIIVSFILYALVCIFYGLEISAWLGLSSSQYKMALITVDDSVKHLKWCQKAADKGNPYGMIMIARAYDAANNVVVKPDWRKARKFYESAAKKLEKMAKRGDAQAKYELSELYRKGKGVGKDYEQSEKLRYEAAEDGYLPAQVDLYRLLEE